MADGTAPIRIQRRRTKGWRMPENTVSVTRPSRWGNPWRVEDIARAIRFGTWDGIAGSGGGLWAAMFLPHRPEYLESAVRMERVAHELATTAAVRMYRELVEHFRRSDRPGFEGWIGPLRGRNVACTCGLDDPCHGDVLLEIANG